MTEEKEKVELKSKDTFSVITFLVIAVFLLINVMAFLAGSNDIVFYSISMLMAMLFSAGVYAVMEAIEDLGKKLEKK